MHMRPTLLACLLLACSKSATPAEPVDPHPPARSATSAAPTSAAPSPVAPHAEAQAAHAAAPQATATSAGGLRWSAGAPLTARVPKSSMRAAEYVVAGDERAELSVFYFGAGQGGAVDANVQRWLGQISQPDGSDTNAEAKRSETEVRGITVARVEAHGTFSSGMGMPGMPASEPIPNAILLGAIASGKEGPVFFKLVGPAEAVERARPAFDALIESLEAE